MPRETFHGRPLPPLLLGFSSPKGKIMFDQSLHAGYLEAYFPLAEQFVTQSTPAFCGLGSLVMVLNSLKVDPGPGQRVWGGVWRWFREENLHIPSALCKTLLQVEQVGITVDEFCLVAQSNGAACDLQRPEQSSIEDFRRVVMAATSRQLEDTFLVVSFSRRVLGQTGDGHFSPVAGYNPETDSVLIMDVARFKYPPYWCPLPLLWMSMRAEDAVTGQQRGFVTISSTAVCPMWTAWKREQDACVSNEHTHCIKRRSDR